ncbi:Transmembrane family 220, helix [Daejeonella rubra]|uniref:Transmembrane family 220, helix n=1 Tax=Daejeonella rubra TaxID=990371 RepID=A0A1G9SH11_9SPHI|nr:transmembrane 220 family protein [Daejeonella rubra]SDM34597.1 Transmembrane family 220, helix [Daejeonella rubra]
MKFFNLTFCILFIISAGLQYNDPDPYLWIPIYLIGAAISFQAFKGKYYPKFTLLIAGLFFIYCIYLFFDKFGVLTWLNDHNAENIAGSMKASEPWIEETREFFGLLILITVLTLNYFKSRRISK